MVSDTRENTLSVLQESLQLQSLQDISHVLSFANKTQFIFYLKSVGKHIVVEIYK